MCMSTKAVWLEIDGDHVADALKQALGSLDGADELLLDFSSVHRIDSSALRALESLAGAADDKPARVVLRGVNVHVYKVLKLIKLAPRLSFLA